MTNLTVPERVLVIGGSGCTGRHLVDRLRGQAAIRVEHGDIDNGQVSREDMAETAETIVQSLAHVQARNKTFEVYAEPGAPPRDWAPLFSRLAADASAQLRVSSGRG